MDEADKHDYWMNQALNLARRAGALGEVPVGAVVVRAGSLLGEGFNQPISAHDPTAHAEIVALRAAALASGNYRLPGATLYVTLEPCMMCAGALVHARIERLVYGTTEPKAGAVHSHGLLGQGWLNHQVAVIGGVGAQPSAAMLSAFFANRRAQQRMNSDR